jgi:monofunctional biosynthetic peptidoglycan transglycosylase
MAVAQRKKRARVQRRVGWRRWAWRAVATFLLLPPTLLLVFAVVPPPMTPLMLLRLAQGHGLSKDWTPLEAIAPALPRSVIAGEDNLFCEHWGFDWKALQGQLNAALDGERPRGASTITMQTAKNLFLWEGRDPLRKALEAWLTPQIELLWTKRRIMEVYLNIVELGPGIYGAEAAARHWLDKPAAKLTPTEAARLAAILPAPLRWKPVRGDAHVVRRGNVIAQRVGQLGPLLDCLD